MEMEQKFEQKPEYTKEQRAQVGLVMIADIQRGEFKYARETESGIGDSEIRLGLYYAIHEHYADPNNLDHMAGLFSEGIEISLLSLKARARAHIFNKALELTKSMDPKALEQVSAMALELIKSDGFQRKEPLIFELRRQEKEQREREKQKKKVAEQQRKQFNSQHQPAPEGTVKELAAKYGKSLGEIRKLKAEGLLHTLITQEADA